MIIHKCPFADFRHDSAVICTKTKKRCEGCSKCHTPAGFINPNCDECTVCFIGHGGDVESLKKTSKYVKCKYAHLCGDSCETCPKCYSPPGYFNPDCPLCSICPDEKSIFENYNISVDLSVIDKPDPFKEWDKIFEEYSTDVQFPKDPLRGVQIDDYDYIIEDILKEVNSSEIKEKLGGYYYAKVIYRGREFDCGLYLATKYEPNDLINDMLRVFKNTAKAVNVKVRGVCEISEFNDIHLIVFKSFPAVVMSNCIVFFVKDIIAYYPDDDWYKVANYNRLLRRIVHLMTELPKNIDESLIINIDYNVVSIKPREDFFEFIKAVMDEGRRYTGLE